MEPQKARAAPHRHPCAEPRGSAGAGTEPTTPWLDQHKASLQVDSATEPRPLQRCNSGKSVLPYKKHHSPGSCAAQPCNGAADRRDAPVSSEPRHPANRFPTSGVWEAPKQGAVTAGSGGHGIWGMTPGASSFLLSHRIVPPLPNTPNHPQFAF